MKKFVILSIVLLFGLIGSVSAQSLSPLGIWTNSEKKATFEIYKCGDKLCGRIVSLTIPNDPKTGRPKTDTQNPNPKLRSRPRLGMVFMQGFEYDEDNKWD
ncbi:SIGNAL peptide protein, partial [Hymenobacter amundsenii]